jgi:hypothetical protein
MHTEFHPQDKTPRLALDSPEKRDFTVREIHQLETTIRAFHQSTTQTMGLA